VLAFEEFQLAVNDVVFDAECERKVTAVQLAAEVQDLEEYLVDQRGVNSQLFD
jgi:hypothetical protein